VAAGVLSDRYRKMDLEHQTWVTCSGVVQILARAECKVAQAFREQLGDWIESMTMNGLAAPNNAKALAQNSAVKQGILTAMREQAAQHLAMLDKLCESEGRLAELSKTQDQHGYQIQALKESKRLYDDALDIGYVSVQEFLCRTSPDLATEGNFRGLGQFMAKLCKEKGCENTEVGWMYNGNPISKKVSVPGSIHQKVNKWKQNTLDWALPRYRKALLEDHSVSHG
jgi:hypothetical protein